MGAVVGVVALGSWFYAIARLPLTTANSLNYMSSVWIAAFMIAGQAPVMEARAGQLFASDCEVSGSACRCSEQPLRKSVPA